MAVDSSLLFFPFSVTTGALGSPGFLPSYSIIINNITILTMTCPFTSLHLYISMSTSTILYNNLHLQVIIGFPLAWNLLGFIKPLQLCSCALLATLYSGLVAHRRMEAEVESAAVSASEYAGKFRDMGYRGIWLLLYTVSMLFHVE